MSASKSSTRGSIVKENHIHQSNKHLVYHNNKIKIKVNLPDFLRYKNLVSRLSGYAFKLIKILVANINNLVLSIKLKIPI